MKYIFKFDFVRWFELGISFFLFFFLVAPKVSNLFIFVLILIVLFGYYKKDISFKFSRIFILFFSFYFFYLIGSIWTNHLSIALGYLEKKISLLLFPLLFSFRLVKGNISLYKPILFFLIGLIFLSIAGFVNSFHCFFVNGSTLCFTSSTLSFVQHPTYFAAFLFFSMGLVWYGYQQKFKFFSYKLVVIYLIFAFIVQFLLVSLAGILYMFLFLFILLLKYLHTKYNRFLIVSSVILFTVSAFFGVKYVPYLKDEVAQSKEAFLIYMQNPDSFIQSRIYPFSGNETRLSMWHVSSQVFKEHILGVGTGNVDDYLGAKIISFGQPEFAALNFNPHNQFLQIAVEIGIFGLILFVFLLGSVLSISVKTRNYLLFILITSLIFNSMFESMLQKQSGMVFYSFWITLLIAHPHLLNEKN